MSPTVTETWYEQVLDEHRRLNEMVAELKEFLNQPRPEVGHKGAHTWAVELSKRLVALHDELFRHFRYEEEGGMVEQLLETHPHATVRIENLVSEHAEMLHGLRRIMAGTLAYSEGISPPEPTLRSQLDRLFRALDEHERTENDLILRLENRELGTGD